MLARAWTCLAVLALIGAAACTDPAQPASASGSASTGTSTGTGTGTGGIGGAGGSEDAGADQEAGAFEALRALFDGRAENGRIAMLYDTHLYLGRLGS